MYNLDDTIVAVASAAGPSVRGIVRISGPAALECVARCLVENSLRGASAPTRQSAVFRCGTGPDLLELPVDLLLWPGNRSYTREPCVEIHAIGSPPLLAAIVDELCRAGARLARPGEFTLRAFLAGRIDLTQAEAVLGVIDARDSGELDAALSQLAGGLAAPLAALRGRLLDLLAELEAGLDFAEEAIEFIDRGELRRQLAAACDAVDQLAAQLAQRSENAAVPRVVLVGLPNAGKSSLFNALAERYGVASPIAALVSPTPGATRDYVVCRLAAHGREWELIDTAGIDPAAQHEGARHAQAAATNQRSRADLVVHCLDALAPTATHDAATLTILTRADLLPHSNDAAHELVASPPTLACSSVTGAGLALLAEEITRRLQRLEPERSRAHFAAATAERCRASLAAARDALRSAAALVDARREELLAAELRAALAGLGEVAGEATTDDVLDRVFSRFCIGK